MTTRNRQRLLYISRQLRRRTPDDFGVVGEYKDEFASRVGCCPSTLKRALEQLESMGVLRVVDVPDYPRRGYVFVKILRTHAELKAMLDGRVAL